MIAHGLQATLNNSEAYLGADYVVIDIPIDYALEINCFYTRDLFGSDYALKFDVQDSVLSEQRNDKKTNTLYSAIFSAHKIDYLINETGII